MLCVILLRVRKSMSLLSAVALSIWATEPGFPESVLPLHALLTRLICTHFLLCPLHCLRLTTHILIYHWILNSGPMPPIMDRGDMLYIYSNAKIETSTHQQEITSGMTVPVCSAWISPWKENVVCTVTKSSLPQTYF